MNTLIQWVSIAVTAYPKEDLEILDKSSTGGAKIKWNFDWVSLTFLLRLNVSSLIAIELTLSIWVLFLYRNGLRKSYRVRYISLNPNFQGFKQYQWLPPRQKSKDRQRRTIGFFCLFFYLMWLPFLLSSLEMQMIQNLNELCLDHHASQKSEQFQLNGCP